MRVCNLLDFDFFLQRQKWREITPEGSARRVARPRAERERRSVKLLNTQLLLLMGREQERETEFVLKLFLCKKIKQITVDLSYVNTCSK